MSEYFDTIPAAIAHRGFSAPGGVSNGLENSMTAFASAVNLGYTYIETDLHGSRDGVAVICHDPTLGRTTDRHGVIAEMDWAEIKQANVGGREPIPRLEELLASWPSLRINLHLKDDSAAKPVAEAIEKYQAHDRVGLTSFSSERRKLTESYLSRPVATGAGTSEMIELESGVRLHSPELVARALFGVDCVQIPAEPGVGPLHMQSVDRDLVTVMHQAGKYVHVWTVDDPKEMNRLLDLGVDGIITNRADLLKQVLISRGEWF